MRFPFKAIIIGILIGAAIFFVPFHFPFFFLFFFLFIISRMFFAPWRRQHRWYREDFIRADGPMPIDGFDYPPYGRPSGPARNFQID